MLWTFQRVMQGETKHPENADLPDVRGREWGLMLPLVVLMFLIGLLPNLLFSRMEASVGQFLQDARPGAVSMVDRQ